MASKLIHDRFFVACFVMGFLFWACYALVIGGLDTHQANATPRQAFFIVLLIPVLEELSFRGLIQEYLWHKAPEKKIYDGISYANAITSVLFVVLHSAYQPWHQALAVFGPSLLFGFFRDRYQSTVPGIILHVWYNSGSFWFPIP